jgi:hypothetical protein
VLGRKYKLKPYWSLERANEKQEEVLDPTVGFTVDAASLTLLSDLQTSK